MELTFTLVTKKASPLVQVLFALVLGWVCILIAHFINAPKGAEYFAAYISIIFYCLMNTIISLAHKSFLKYTIPSYYLYVALVAVLLLSSKFLSGISIWDLWIYRSMLVSITIFYFVASTFVRGIRLIYELAESGF